MSERENGDGARRIRHRYGDISDFGAKVANLLDAWVDGIYHLNQTSLSKVDWKREDWITVCVGDGRFSTFDANDMTKLVVLCHDRCIRCEVEAATRRYFRLHFHPRERTGDTYHRHPTMEEAIAKIRKEIANQ